MTQTPPQTRQTPEPGADVPGLLYTEIEEELRSSVRALLADRCPPAAVVTRCEGPGPLDAGLWHTLGRQLGTGSLPVPERLGGAGASWRETAVVLEELGRSAAPTPFLGHAVLATAALLALDTPASREVLAPLARGERTGTLAVPLSAGTASGRFDGVRVTGDGALTGEVTSVADTAPADVLVVPATGPDGPALYAVETTGPGVSLAPRVCLDLTRPLADVGFRDAAARPLGGQAPAALETALRTGAGMLAAEQLGIAEWCLETTVAYVRERRQFGRAVGSFQAVKHRLADLWLAVVGARAAARNAAAALAGGTPQAPVAVAVAAAHCGDTAVRAAEECVQLHGGIGMTWELPVHLFLKRAKADQLALGTPGHHRAALAGPADLPAPGA